MIPKRGPTRGLAERRGSRKGDTHMRIGDVLSRGGICDVVATEKRGVLTALARHAAAMLDMDARTVFEAMNRREDLGSTGVGSGVGVPHARFETIRRASGVYATLRSPVDFGASDDRPVDLVFMLLLPDRLPEQHLKPLACVARRLRDPNIQAALRRATDASATYDLLVSD